MNNNTIPDECELPDCDSDGDVQLDDFACFQTCFGATDPLCSASFDRALPIGGPINQNDYAFFNMQFGAPCVVGTQMMSSGSGGSTAGSSVTVTNQNLPVGSVEPDPCTIIDAALAFEVRPIGGREPVVVLAENTTYDVRYKADYHAVQDYMVAVLSTSADVGFAATEPASSGAWSKTGNFMWIDMSHAPDWPVEAIGYPEGYYMLGLVGDIGEAGPQGELFRFTTGFAGDLTLDLKMWEVDEAKRLAVSMESHARFLVKK